MLKGFWNPQFQIEIIVVAITFNLPLFVMNDLLWQFQSIAPKQLIFLPQSNPNEMRTSLQSNPNEMKHLFPSWSNPNETRHKFLGVIPMKREQSFFTLKDVPTSSEKF